MNADPQPARAPSRGGLPPAYRVPILVLGFLGLLAGALAGLARLGWPVPVIAAGNASLHGPLMVCAFFGVVISLERAVAIGHRVAYLAPLVGGLGGVAAIAGMAGLAPWLFVAGSAMLLLGTLDIFNRQRALFTFTLTAGALAWVVGNVIWAAGAAPYLAVPWWLAFLILTIAGERLELSRFLPPSPVAARVFAAILAGVGTGLVAAGEAWGSSVFAASLLALAAWLLRQDIARRTVRSTGLTRYIAVCLLSGYLWLAFGAAITLGAGSLQPGTATYDAAVHALGLGFVFSMVFGHAPIIVPAVLRVAVPYNPTFYFPLALLHLSLLLRVIGDVTGVFAWTHAGGLLNAIALAAFIANTAAAILVARRRARASIG